MLYLLSCGSIVKNNSLYIFAENRFFIVLIEFLPTFFINMIFLGAVKIEYKFKKGHTFGNVGLFTYDFYFWLQK